jgi:uncharacterized protein YjiS (DUF1127 family)
MVIVYSAANFPPPATLSSRMARLLTKGWDALKDRGERARVRALLYGMEDRELKDLGFTRSEIESVRVIAWDSLDQATAYFNSLPFKELQPLRDKAAKVLNFHVEGVAR